MSLLHGMRSAVNYKIGTKAALALVISNMIGTGVFTSLGFQLADISTTPGILFLWILGGVIAIGGAFSYAELGAYFGRSGGEYHYLTRIYHPLVGYLSGWVSLTVGFAAPIALAAMAMAAYLGELMAISPPLLASGAIVGISLIHSMTLRHSQRFQWWTTLLKVGLILAFILAGMIISPSEAGSIDWTIKWQGEILTPAFAVALVYVTYAYSGWNAAAYIVDEIQSPAKSLPKALVGGTVLVTVLYVLLHYVFLRHAAVAELVGKVEIGQIVANNLFGITGGKLISISIAVFLISSISAMVWVGPRVSMIMAEDYAFWRFLENRNSAGIPVRAIWFQTVISLGLVWTGTFETVLIYCGFILQIFALLAVAGTFILRSQNVDLPYRNPTHPWLPAMFIMIGLWITFYLLMEHPRESMWGLTNLAAGFILYLISKKQSK